MPATRFGLYELLSPSFLAGFTFPAHIDRYLSTLGVDSMRAAVDETGVVYAGRCSFVGQGGAAPVREHRDPDGRVFYWEDVTLDFRLTVPRDGAQFIRDAVIAIADAPISEPELRDLLDVFGAVEQTAAPTEYPGVRFRLEILVSVLTFHLGNSWIPGKVGSDFRVVPDTDATSQDVKIIVPKVVFEYEQGDDLGQAPRFRIKSWGNSGFDAPSDLAAGELVRMEPAIALHTSGRWGFSVEQIILDLSPDHTPPEILAFFGTDESFEGLFIKQLRLFWADKDKDWAFNIAVRDALISFKGEVSLETSLDIMGPKSKLAVETHFYEGTRDVDYTRGRPHEENANDLVGGAATVLNTGYVQVHVTGGVPPITTTVTLNGSPIWDAPNRRAPLSPAPDNLRSAGTYNLVVHVEDSGAGTAKQTFNEAITVTLTAASAPPPTPSGLPADNAHEQQGALPQAALTITSTTPSPLPDGFGLSHEPATSGTLETVSVTGGTAATLTVSVDGDAPALNGRSFTTEVAAGQTRTIVVSTPAVPSAPETVELRFDFERPDPNPDAGRNPDPLARYLDGGMNPPDAEFLRTVPAFRQWIETRVRAGASFEVHAHASFENSTAAARNQRLSQRRLEVAQAIIHQLRAGATISPAQAHGASEAQASGNPSDASWRVARVTAEIQPVSEAATIHASIHRDPRPSVTPPPGPVTHAPPGAPPPHANRPPSAFRRLGVRLRLERNIPVLAEVRGELDFETELEGRLRAQPDSVPTGDLQMRQQDGASANPNPEDGVVDFKLTITYDTATRFLTESLSIGASPNDTDGLLRMTNDQQNPRTAQNVFKDIFGALLVFTPVIQDAASSLDPASAGDWAGLAVSFAIPVALGALGAFKTTSITLYGGELKLKQHVPGDAPAEFTDAGVVFDYGVEFGIDLPFPPIRSTRPLKVRYKAVGFNLHFPPDPDPSVPDVVYQPIFDTSKGYTIDLSDPGLFSLPAPFGDLLKILGAKIARINPLVLEFDLGLKVDLGVITVDKFKVSWPIEPLGAPRILPTGVKIDVPGTVIGKGSVDFRETPLGWAIKGFIDISIVPVKLRVAASLAVEPVEKDGRRATGVYAGITVEFPTPILLGASGLGIFGLSGLFAMHFRRTEDKNPDPAEAVGPALKWLVKAKGQPELLMLPASEGGAILWEAELDRWAFGVGAILGSVDGGFLVNLRGMFVLELPGPRILIFIKMLIVAQLPQLGDGELTVGMLGVLDLNFEANTITVGVIVDLKVEDLIELKLPIELFFDLDEGHKWHLYIGKHTSMASANILGLVRARGYFMIDGQDITNFPPGATTQYTLPGIAVATGLEASILLGSEAIGLYLKVAAGAHLGVAFSPFFIVGRAFLKGELRLFIISIEARGEIEVRAPKPTLLDCHVCGKIDLFFFSIEGCVDFHIGSGSHDLEPPPLVRNVYLQSHAPVLVAGQGGERPIDATLGDARPFGGPGEMPEVPVDSVPVIQLHAPPVVSGASTFTAPLAVPPNKTADDFIDVGGGRQVKYTITSIAISPPVAGAGTIPATWRPEQGSGPQGSKTNIDLALMSRVPTPGEHALERSNDLDLQVEQRWGGLCTPIAKPVCVVFSFCGQAIGPSGSGWTIAGHAQPDAPGTRRRTPPPTTLRVDEPVRAAELGFLDILSRGAGGSYRDPALVLGRDPVELELVCTGFDKEGKQPNPLPQDGFTFTVWKGDKPADAAEVLNWDGIVGLHVQTQTVVALPAASDEVTLVLACFAAPVIVEGLDADQKLVAKVEAKGDPKPEVVVLVGPAIRSVRIVAPSDETLLLSVCYKPSGKQGGKKGQLPAGACTRALQLPLARQRQLDNPIELDGQLDNLLQETGDDRWITFRTGAGNARVFMAVDQRLIKAGGLRVRQLDATGQILVEEELEDIPTLPISGITGLPADWLDPNGPWAADVLPVAQFLAEAQFATLKKILFTVKNQGERLQLAIPAQFKDYDVPARAIVGVIEVCPQSEKIRWQSETAVADGELKTLTGYLGGGAPVPLLANNTVYTLTIHYDAVARDKDGNLTDYAGKSQSFQFRTDDRPPARLDAYVYGSTPQQDEKFHFYEDPVKLVFNDDAIVQLYAQYGKQLRFVVRGADGVPLPTAEVVDMDAVAAEFGAPYREALLALMAKYPDWFNCVGGSFTVGHHASWTSPVPLLPCMNYSFDIELDPPYPVPPGDEKKPVVPLFRRSFTTSRFTSLAALIDATRGRRILHRALAAPLGFTGAGEVVLPDRSIEEALTLAGEQALPAPSDTGFTIYWVFRPALSKFVPHAILIDAAEPLWRLRDEPTLEPVPNQPDPAFKRLVPATRQALRLAQLGGAQIARFVRSPAGTRTVAVFADSFVPAAGGTTIEIVAVVPPSVLYDIAADTRTLLQITLQPVAPWEEQP
ncbi:hypothetical protein [Nannocystis radixulma]|uniref:OmpA family protein n=1 Tax=Nannocystis radixulma TaxID=2995305 RepID=A0ABT5AX33_9BACT|nr:hypothetical protein [Nannocystis radixulma]MDC0666395.1 hypothetical protein [Nannocystis radixulma]